MTDIREVYTILEDDSTGAGVKLPARAEGDTAGGNHVPSMVAKDASGNYQLLRLRQAGAASASLDSMPVLGSVDLSGNLQFINQRLEGATASGVNALPGLVAKDPSGNLIYLATNANGHIIFDDEGGGTPIDGQGSIAAVVGSFVTVLDMALTASKNYHQLDFIVAATRTVVWEIASVDDAGVGDTETTLVAGIVTGPGQFSFAKLMDDLNFSSGSTGSQTLRIKGKQLFGSATDLYATASVVEKV